MKANKITLARAQYEQYKSIWEQAFEDLDIQDLFDYFPSGTVGHETYCDMSFLTAVETFLENRKAKFKPPMQLELFDDKT
jgi:hypothetical protein